MNMRMIGKTSKSDSHLHGEWRVISHTAITLGTWEVIYTKICNQTKLTAQPLNPVHSSKIEMLSTSQSQCCKPTNQHFSHFNAFKKFKSLLHELYWNSSSHKNIVFPKNFAWEGGWAEVICAFSKTFLLNDIPHILHSNFECLDFICSCSSIVDLVR